MANNKFVFALMFDANLAKSGTILYYGKDLNFGSDAALNADRIKGHADFPGTPATLDILEQFGYYQAKVGTVDKVTLTGVADFSDLVVSSTGKRTLMLTNGEPMMVNPATGIPSQDTKVNEMFFQPLVEFIVNTCLRPDKPEIPTPFIWITYPLAPLNDGDGILILNGNEGIGGFL